MTRAPAPGPASDPEPDAVPVPFDSLRGVSDVKAGSRCKR
jgi:hypothetical protein